MEGKYDENKDFYLNDNRFNEEEQAENDKRGIDNPDLNRDRDSSLDKDRDFDTETENEEDEDSDDFLDDGFQEGDGSLTDDEDFDEDPQETKRNQNRTGSETNPE